MVLEGRLKFLLAILCGAIEYSNETAQLEEGPLGGLLVSFADRMNAPREMERGGGNEPAELPFEERECSAWEECTVDPAVCGMKGKSSSVVSSL